MSLGRVLAAVLVTAGLTVPALAQQQPVYGKRDNIFIVTSTLNRVYSDAIGERFASEYGYARPLVKTTIASVAIDAFCSGVGSEFPDVVAVPRRMARRELTKCIKNGILDVVELDLDYDALVIATKKGDPVFNMDLKTLYKALANEVPKGDGPFDDFEPNTKARWSQIDPSLPDLPIKVLGPAQGTAILKFMKDFFMEGACRKIPVFKVYYTADDRVRQCTTLRSDGVYTEIQVPIARNFVETMRQAPAGTLVVLPYTTWQEHRDWLDVLPVDGVAPGRESIAGFDYVPVYPVRMYVKRAHMRPGVGGYGIVDGLYEFIHEAMSEEAIGPGGYLEKSGLVADTAEERERNRRAALRLERFVR